MKVIYHPLAEKDIDQVFDHYQKILASLAEAFLKEFNACIVAITNQPLRYRLVRGDVRKCRMNRFPYALYFVLEKETIRILILKHTRRHPSYGMTREQE